MKDKKIGWIGTGVMGKAMCSHILKAGYPLTVYTRTREKAGDLLGHGAVWADSPMDVAAGSDIIFSIVGYPKDVEEVILGEKGVLAGAGKGAVIVDMTTSEPGLARKIAEEAKKRGVSTLDAPVSGGDVGAREARLAIMVGGSRKVYADILPLFSLMGKNIRYMGEAGAGQHTKMCNQIVVGGTMIGVCESLIYTE